MRRVLQGPQQAMQGVLRAAGGQAPLMAPAQAHLTLLPGMAAGAPPDGPRMAPREDHPVKPPDFGLRYIWTNVCAKAKQQSAFEGLPNVGKACIMPWDV